MKEFEYRWKMGNREIRGIKKAESREALGAHVAALGGKLIEITAERDLPEKAPEPAPAAPVEAAPPEVSLSGTNLLSPLRRGRKPDWLIVLIGWLSILTGGFIAIASIALLVSGLAGGFDWMGSLSTPEEKVFILSILVSLGALQLILGIQMLRKPVFGAWLLLLTSLASLVPATVHVLSKRYAPGFIDAALAAFVIWHICRRRR